MTKYNNDKYEKMLEEVLEYGLPSFMKNSVIHELARIKAEKYLSRKEPITYHKIIYRRNV